MSTTIQDLQDKLRSARLTLCRLEDRFDDLRYRFKKSAWKAPIIMLLAISCASGIGYAGFRAGYSLGSGDGNASATERVKECYDNYIIKYIGRNMANPDQLTQDADSLPYFSSFVTSQRKLRNCIYISN